MPLISKISPARYGSYLEMSVNSQAENVTERNRFNSPKFIEPIYAAHIFFFCIWASPNARLLTSQKMKHGVTEKGKR